MFFEMRFDSPANLPWLNQQNGVHMFTLDPTLNELVLTNPNVRIPKRGNIYSCNESNSEGRVTMNLV